MLYIYLRTFLVVVFKLLKYDLLLFSEGELVEEYAEPIAVEATEVGLQYANVPFFINLYVNMS